MRKQTSAILIASLSVVATHVAIAESVGLSRDEVAHWDAVNAYGAEAKVYEGGIVRESVASRKEAGLPINLRLSPIAIDVASAMNVTLSTRFLNGSNAAGVDIIEMTIDGKRLSISMQSADRDSMFDNTRLGGRLEGKVRPETIERLKKDYKTPLNLADYLFGIDRKKVTSAEWPQSSDLLCLFNSYVQPFIGSEHDVFRVETANHVIFCGSSVTAGKRVGLLKVYDRKSGDIIADGVYQADDQKADTSQREFLLSLCSLFCQRR